MLEAAGDESQTGDSLMTIRLLKDTFSEKTNRLLAFLVQKWDHAQPSNHEEIDRCKTDDLHRLQPTSDEVTTMAPWGKDEFVWISIITSLTL